MQIFFGRVKDWLFLELEKIKAKRLCLNSATLVMPIRDPQGGFFYSTLAIEFCQVSYLFLVTAMNMKYRNNNFCGQSGGQVWPEPIHS